jgi:NAD+ diphosphatase
LLFTLYDSKEPSTADFDRLARIQIPQLLRAKKDDCYGIPYYAGTMPSEFIPSVVPPGSQNPDAWWFIYSGYRLLVKISGDTVAIPRAKEIEALGVSFSHSVYLGSFRGRACYAAEGKLPVESLSEAAFQELRSLFARLEDEFYEIALLGVHLVEWDKNYQFCSRCRGAFKSRSDMRAKECEKCGRLEFPRISPAIIVLVEKGDTLLLARSARFAGGFSSVLAGFVEPGESLEEAVCREVKEETAITVKDIAYFGSQPWPFPDSLMIGFTAQYASGEICVDGEEVIEAGWYKFDSLPQIPGKLSIARQLIDWFIQKHS